MNTPTPTPAVPSAPRRIPWTRWLLYAAGLFSVLAVAVFFWLRSYSTITVAKETTYLTAPLAADGYPDYIAYLNELNSAGITPENNAWIPLMRYTIPELLNDQARARHYQKLGIPEQALSLAAFQPFGSKTFRQQVPDEILVASSASAQWPWHVRLARLLTLNAEKKAQQIVNYGLETVHEWDRSKTAQVVISELGSDAMVASTELMLAIAEDPTIEFLIEELLPYAEADPLETDPDLVRDEEPLPDLREEALSALRPLDLVTPGETLAWRKKQFDLARDRLFERETQIISVRPWSRAECPIAAYWLDTQSAVVDGLMEEIASRSAFYAPYLESDDPQDRSMDALALPGSKQLISLSIFLQLRAFQAIERGDFAAAKHDVDALLKLSKYFPAQPLMFEGLAAIWAHESAMKTIAALVGYLQLTDEQLAQLAKTLEQPQPFPDALRSLQALRLVYLDVVLTLGARGGSGEISLQQYPRTMVRWDDALIHVNVLFEQMRAAAQNNDWTAMQALKNQISNHPGANGYDALLPSQRTDSVKYGVPRSIMSPVFYYYGQLLQAELQRDAARVLIALERFRRANNAYPAALADLVPAYLPAVPNDPFDGKSLKYFRTDTGGYRAYSVATNGLDDGGNFQLNDEIRADGYRYDFVIGSPDEVPRRQNLAW